MKIRTLTLLVILFSFLSACREKSVYSGFTGFAQGTTYNMVVENPGNLNIEELKAGVIPITVKRKIH